MAAPIKKYKLGKIEAAIFLSEKYNSQSVKFQKSWMDNNKQWQHIDFFTVADLRDLYALVGWMLMRQIKEEPVKPQTIQRLQPSDR